MQKRSQSPMAGKKLSPIYMDLAYVPHHGNSYYTHVEFFKKIRARYYVFSGTEPSKEAYNALLEAKQTWEDKNLGKLFETSHDEFFMKFDLVLQKSQSSQHTTQTCSVTGCLRTKSFWQSITSISHLRQHVAQSICKTMRRRAQPIDWSSRQRVFSYSFQYFSVPIRMSRRNFVNYLTREV